MKIILAILALALAGCTSVSVKTPDCDQVLPPINTKYLEPCEEPPPLPDGKLSTMYEQMISDLGPWGRCIRKHDQLIATVELREQVCAKLREQIKQQESKPWWRLW